MFLYRVLLLISLISLLGAIQESTHCSALRKKDEECGSYCYKIVKPLLSYAASVRSKEEQFSELTAKIQSLEATIRSLETQLETTKSIQEFKNELLSSNQDIVDKLQNIIDTKNSNANALNTEIKEKDSEIIKLKLKEEEHFKLKSLGDFSGNAEDSMVYHLNMMFSTPDEDNDKTSDRHCGKDYNSGWWFDSCYYSNLNGIYRKEGILSDRGVDWNYWQRSSLEFVQMMIRPKN